MRHFLNNLTQINSADEDARRHGKNAIIMALGLIAISLLSAPTIWFMERSLIGIALYIGIPVILYIAVILLIRSGKVTLGAVLLIIILLLSLLIPTAIIEGSQATVFLLMLSIPLTSLTLRPKYTWVVLMCVILGSIVATSINPLYSKEPSQKINDLVTQALLGVCVASISFVNARSTDSALKRTRQSREIAERSSDRLASTKTELEQLVSKRTAELEASLLTAQEHEERLNTTIAELHTNQQTFQELGVPLLPVLPSVIVAVIVGSLNKEQVDAFIQHVLYVVKRDQIHTVICDTTAVPSLTMNVAEQLFQVAQNIELLGAKTIFVGIRPEVAEVLAPAKMNFKELIIFADLQDAIMSLLPKAKGKNHVTSRA